MEREIEIKLLGLNVDQLEKELLARGATFLGREKQKNIRINSTLCTIPKEKGYLRIRTVIRKGEKEIHQFTFKESITEIGVRENLEHTTEIGDPQALLKILNLMGFDQLKEGEKDRKSYAYQGLRFDFDTWDKDSYPHPYIEVEGPSMEEIYGVLDDLSIDKRHVSTLSIAELIKKLKK
ncbi:MAG: class IV adenylate cyclase [Tissierellia bacterium]|nr:class IV adenylate cyclase [Tissierellia bacterium]